MKKLILGIVIGFLLVLAMGAAYDKTYFQHDIYYLDGWGIYFGTGGDSYMEWDNSNSEVDWTITAGSINITLTGQSDDMAGLYVNCTVPTGQQSWGAVYGDMTIAGTTDGPCHAVSGIVWLDSSSAPAHQIVGGKFGVNETSAALAGADVIGIVIETLLNTGGTDPDEHYMMRFNTSAGAEAPDAWFQAANKAAIAYTDSTTHTGSGTSKVGAIAIYIVGAAANPNYLYVYDHIGE